MIITASLIHTHYELLQHTLGLLNLCSLVVARQRVLTLFSSAHVAVYKVRVGVTLRPGIYRESVRLGAKPLETHDQRVFFPPPNLTLTLYTSKQASSSLLLAFAGMVILGIGTHDHIFVLICNPYGIRRWASSSVRGGVGLFNAVIHFIRC
jgi:hypothetical protein